MGGFWSNLHRYIVWRGGEGGGGGGKSQLDFCDLELDLIFKSHWRFEMSNFDENMVIAHYPLNREWWILAKLKIIYHTGLRSAVGNVSEWRYVSDCRSRGCEFDPGPVPYFHGDWSWNIFYNHSPPFRWFKKGCCQVQAKVYLKPLKTQLIQILFFLYIAT